jgi:phage-related tail protein
MATLTEFTNLAEISDRQNSADSTNSCVNFSENSSYGEGYSIVSENDIISNANGLPAVPKLLMKPRSDVQGSTISFHNLKYTVEVKDKRKKVTKMIVKGIRYFF